MKEMIRSEALHFLVSEPRTAKVATVREDGSPHVTPVWIALDGEKIVFTTWHKGMKADNLRRDGRVALCVDDEQPPFSYVMVEGTVEISEDVDDVRRWATVIATRYMGEEQGEAFGKRNGVPGELLVRVTPTKVVGQRDLAE